jgi:hypothetical protein
MQMAGDADPAVKQGELRTASVGYSKSYRDKKKVASDVRRDPPQKPDLKVVQTSLDNAPVISVEVSVNRCQR